MDKNEIMKLNKIYYLQYFHETHLLIFNRLIFVVGTHVRSQHISVFIPLVTKLALHLAALVGCHEMSGGVALGAEGFDAQQTRPLLCFRVHH